MSRRRSASSAAISTKRPSNSGSTSAKRAVRGKSLKFSARSRPSKIPNQFVSGRWGDRQLRGVTEGMPVLPLPRALNHLHQFGMPRLPSQFPFELGRTRAKYGWIARPTRRDANRNLSTGNFLRRADDFPHRISLAQSDVVCRHASNLHPLQRKNVCCRNVGNMNIVADTSAVGSIVVIAVDLEIGPMTRGRLQQQRNNVRLRPMIYSRSRGRSRSVEIAEGNDSPAIGGRIPSEHPLEHPFGFTVGINWLFPVIF